MIELKVFKGANGYKTSLTSGGTLEELTLETAAGIRAIYARIENDGDSNKTELFRKMLQIALDNDGLWKDRSMAKRTEEGVLS